MTNQECEERINIRLREYFENRKKIACIRDRLQSLAQAITQILDNPMHASLDESPESLARDVAELRRLHSEQSTIYSFLTRNGISDLP